MNHKRSIIPLGEGDTSSGWRVPRPPNWVLIVALSLVAVGAAVKIASSRASRGRELITRALSAYAAAEWNKAADVARQRLREAPDDVSALRLLARSSARLGRDSVANALFARLGSDSLEAEDLYLLGVELDRAGRKQEAQRLWEKALTLAPNDAEVLERLVTLYASQNRTIEAADLAERLARIPGFETRGELTWASLRFQLGDLACRRRASEATAGRASGLPLGSISDDAVSENAGTISLGDRRPREVREVLKVTSAKGQDAETSWLLSRAFLQEGASKPRRWRHSRTRKLSRGALSGMGASLVFGRGPRAKCHQEIFQIHQKSRHASTLLRGQNLAKLPFPAQPIRDPDDAAVVHSFTRAEGQVHFQTREGDKVRRAVVAYEFGSPDHYVSLVGPEEHGPPYIMRLSHYQNGNESGWTRTSGHSSGGEGTHDLFWESQLEAFGWGLQMSLLSFDRPEVSSREFRPGISRSCDRL